MPKAAIDIFGGPSSREGVKVFFAAHRYIQGPEVLKDIGTYLPMVGSKRPGILIPGDLPASIGQTIEASFSEVEVEVIQSRFGGQCSYEEIDAQVAAFRTSEIDGLVAVGGGKVIDAAKCIARRLGVALVICPTLASTDAPCSAAAVIYTNEGVFKDVEFLPSNPDMVVVDTAVIAKAPLRFLLAGMADALATGYEARTCFSNPLARSMVGGRITVAAATIADVCSRTIFDHAEEAVASVKAGVPSHSFEHVVEANTLLSGTGFESGGLAAAHAIASALTVAPSIEHNFLHGEMVAVGIMIHLQLEGNLTELERVDEFLRKFELPRSLSDLGLRVEPRDATLQTIVDAACALPFMKNEPFPVDAASLMDAILAVERRVQQSSKAA